jgi:hypothetical protein
MDGENGSITKHFQTTTGGVLVEEIFIFQNVHIQQKH